MYIITKNKDSSVSVWQALVAAYCLNEGWKTAQTNYRL